MAILWNFMVHACFFWLWWRIWSFDGFIAGFHASLWLINHQPGRYKRCFLLWNKLDFNGYDDKHHKLRYEARRDYSNTVRHIVSSIFLWLHMAIYGHIYILIDSYICTQRMMDRHPVSNSRRLYGATCLARRSGALSAHSSRGGSLGSRDPPVAVGTSPENPPVVMGTVASGYDIHSLPWKDPPCY